MVFYEGQGVFALILFYAFENFFKLMENFCNKIKIKIHSIYVMIKQVVFSENWYQEIRG